MPLPNPFAGWPALSLALQQWGQLLLQPLAPVALTTFHDADPVRRRFVGTLGAAANLDAAAPAGADVGVLMSGTGNVLAQPPTLGAEIRWNSRSAGVGVAGLAVRGEFGLEQTVMPPHGGDHPVLFFELLPDAGAGQAQSITLGAKATQRATSTTLVLLASAVSSPGPVRMRVGVATGTATAQTAKNVSAGGANVQAGFLDDGGTGSLADGGANDIAALELELTNPASGAVNLAGQLRVEIVIPTDPSTGPTVSVSGAAGLDLGVTLLLGDATGSVRAAVDVTQLPEQLEVEVTPAAAGAGTTSVRWSTGTAAAPRSARLPALAATVDLAPAAGPPVRLEASLTDVPPGVDLAVADASLAVHATDAAGPSPIGGVSAALISAGQIPPALTDFVWLDALAESAAANVRSLHTAQVGWPAGAPVTATLGFGDRHPLTGFVTTAGLRGSATIDALPHTAAITVDPATLAIGWQGSEPIDDVRADITVVSTDAATGAGTGITHVVAELEGLPTAFDAALATDDVHLTFTPAAPTRAAATIELAPPGAWQPGEAPPAVPAYDRRITADLTGIPQELSVHASPDFAALETGTARLDWQATGDLAYGIVALDGFALGPISHVRARVGELPPRLAAAIDLSALRFDVRATNGGRIGAIHAQASSAPITPGAGAAPRRLDAGIDLRGGAFTVDATVRGLERVQVDDLPHDGAPFKIDVTADFGAPGAFPGGFTADGPQLRARLRTDDLEGTADARSFPDHLEFHGDLNALTLDARLPLVDLDVDAAGSIAVAGSTFSFDADVRAPAVPARLELSAARDQNGALTDVTYDASGRFTDLLVEAQVTPAPIVGLAHGRAIVDLPEHMELNVPEPRFDAPGGIAAFARVRSSVNVPLPTTSRRGQIVRVVTVPAAPSTSSLSLGSMGFVEAACAKVRNFQGFRMTTPGGAGGGSTTLRGPRILLTGAGEDERVFASIQRRLGRNRLLRLVQAQLDFIRPSRIDLLLAPGPMGEIGVRFPGPLRPVGGAATLGRFAVRLEPSYVGVPGGPPVGERDPAFVVPGLTTAGIGGVSGTVACVPAHVEVAMAALGPFGTTPTPVTVSDPAGGGSVTIPAGWGGQRVDLFLDGNLALRDLDAVLYSLDWRRSQHWQRITASRIDLQPTGRTSGMTPATRALTIHQFGLDPTVANGGSGGTGVALTIPSNVPVNVSAVIRSAEFPRPATVVAPSAPSGFSSPVQVDVGNFSGFLGVRLDPIFGTPLVPTIVDATDAPPTEWRIVAATPVGPAFIGNTGVVPLSVIGHIGLALATALVGGVFFGPIGLFVGASGGVLAAEFFTARNAPVLAALPAAGD